MYVYIYVCMSAGTGFEHRYIYISMRKMGFSNEFVVVLLSIMSLVSALSFMFVIKLLKEMRDSAWNIGYNVMVAAKAPERVAGKAGCIERRIMAGQFNSWEMRRQVINAFYEWPPDENVSDTETELEEDEEDELLTGVPRKRMRTQSSFEGEQGFQC